MPERENPSDPAAVGQLQENFSGIAGVPPRQSLATNPLEAPPEEDEIPRLRRSVLEKDHALLRAALSETNLQQKLDDVTAEADKLRLELATLRPPDDTARKTEMRQVRGQALQFQRQFETELRARRLEAAQSA